MSTRLRSARRSFTSALSLTYLLTLAVLAVMLFPRAANAQGGFFQHFFNAGQGGGEAREQEAPPSGDSQWWNARVEAAQCSKYLCPRTLSCVDKPSYCPCPFPQQVRCAYPDGESGNMDIGGNHCVQEKDCNRVMLMRALGSSFKLSDLK